MIPCFFYIIEHKYCIELHTHQVQLQSFQALYFAKPNIIIVIIQFVLDLLSEVLLDTPQNTEYQKCLETFDHIVYVTV